MLKPQDILVALKIIALDKENWSYESLASSLGMSISQVYSSVQRGKRLNLLLLDDKRLIANPLTLEELIVHGLRYMFEIKSGALTVGIPTSYAAPPLNSLLSSSKVEPPPVWPDPQGTVEGFAFSPIYKFAPAAAKKDQHLYELLALVDTIRSEGPREKNIAIDELKKRFAKYG